MNENSLYLSFIKFFTKQKGYTVEVFKIIGFGLLSLILGKIRFYIPGVEGGVSDLREIALVISIFYFRHWMPLVFISIITSLATPDDGLFISSFSIHAFSLVILFYIYKLLNKKVINRFLISGVWFFVVFGYFIVLLIPSMVITYVLFDRFELIDFQSNCLNILVMIRFEMISTAAVTALFLLNIKTTELLEYQNIDLLKSKKKAEESEQLKTAFLQNLSHEIRTPMNAILGFSRLLQFNSSNNEQIQYFTQLIVSSGEQLLTIVSDVIDASQIETQQLKFNESENSLEETINEILGIFKARGDTSYSRIRTMINSSGEERIKTDIYKISRCIYHLLDNALKFSDDKPVELECSVIDGNLSLAVKDIGLGIDKKNWEIIFESFRQLDIDSTRTYGGNGLGLTITKGFMNYLNGNIWLISELGKGSTFFISIPLCKNRSNNAS